MCVLSNHWDFNISSLILIAISIRYAIGTDHDLSLTCMFLLFRREIVAEFVLINLEIKSLKHTENYSINLHGIKRYRYHNEY